MVLKKHDDKPWEWVKDKCFLSASQQTECDGVMELKDVNLEGGSMFSEAQYPVEYKAPTLEKIWVCNKCGFVLVE